MTWLGILDAALQKSLNGSIIPSRCDMMAALEPWQNAPWCHICPADKRTCHHLPPLDSQEHHQSVGLFRVLGKIIWCISSVVLTMPFCSRHVSLIMWKLFKDLSSLEDADDPKGISRHLSWRWRRGCERVEQHRLCLYICVCLCVRIFA